MESMAIMNTEKLNMEPKRSILFGNNEIIRLFVKTKYEKNFLATSLSLYPINSNPDTPPICSFFTTNGRRYTLDSQCGSKRYLEGRGGQKMSITSKRKTGYHQYHTVNIQDGDIYLVEVKRTYPNPDMPFPEPSYELVSMRQRNDSLEDQIEFMLQYCRIRKVFKRTEIFLSEKQQAWGHSITANGFGNAGKTFSKVHPGYSKMMRNRVFKYDYSGIICYNTAYKCFDLFVGSELAENDEKLFNYLATYIVPQRDHNIWGIVKDEFVDSWMDFPPTSFPDVRCTLNWKGEWKTW